MSNPDLTRQFQIFVKPAGAECNLRCHYCYYKGIGGFSEKPGQVRMSDEVLERFIKSHFEACTEQTAFFSWHGGEPLLAGVEFFKKAVMLQKALCPAGRSFMNGIQTNATLINEESARFMSDEGFIAGVSIDGPEVFHNKFRISRTQCGSFKEALRGYELLRRFNVPVELLTVVSSANEGHPLSIYGFLKQLGSPFITFLPLVIRDSSELSGVGKASVSPVGFGDFLSAIFDEWVAEDIGRIKIQIFEEAARTAFEQDHTLCIFKKTCGGVPVVEHNGDFFSCDHYVDEDHLIGNILENSLSEMLDCDRQQKFGLAKYQSLPQYCLDCKVIDMCNGECPKNRFITTPYGENGLNYLCEGYKKLFTHIKPFVDSIAGEWRKQKSN